MKKRLVSGSLIVALATSAGASAATVYSNLGSGSGPNGVFNSDGYQNYGFEVIPPPTGPTQVALAAEFVASTSVGVTQIDVALSSEFSGSPATSVVSLWTNSSGSPGVELGSWTVATNAQQVGTLGNTALTSITGITGVSVTQGSSYFLEVAAPGSTNAGAWDVNVQGLSGEFTSYNGAPFVADRLGTTGAFDVQGTAVPLPAAAWLLLSGLGGLGIFARKRFAV